MSVQLQVQIKDDEWSDITGDQLQWAIDVGLKIRALEQVDAPPPPKFEGEEIYQFRWINTKPIGPWNPQSKGSHDVCVQQLTENNPPRNDIQVRVVRPVQIGEIIGPPTPAEKK